MGGNEFQIINAAALAVKNPLGLTCGSVAELVEIPLLKETSKGGLALTKKVVKAAY